MSLTSKLRSKRKPFRLASEGLSRRERLYNNGFVRFSKVNNVVCKCLKHSDNNTTKYFIVYFDKSFFVRNFVRKF